MPTQEIMNAWMNWFESISDKTADSGFGFGRAKEITRDGSSDLAIGPDSMTGYTIIYAENFEEAEAIAKTCPIITGIRVYEARSI